MENYVPKLHVEANHVYVEMLIEGKLCHICKKPMVRQGNALMNGGVFPNYIGLNIEEQAKKGCLEFMSGIKVDDKEICVTCKEAGKADFLCQSCHERKLSNKISESFGDPADYLCADCYDTVPARIWDSLCEDLRSKHRYDYE